MPNVFWRRYSHTVEQALDVEAMQRAAGYLLGEHDFKSFTSTKKGKKSTVRNIKSIDIRKEGDMLIFTFQGDGFLYHMIRILMGTLLEVGMGLRQADSIPEIIAAGDREAAGVLVPAKGLVLEKFFTDKSNRINKKFTLLMKRRILLRCLNICKRTLSALERCEILWKRILSYLIIEQRSSKEWYPC